MHFSSFQVQRECEEQVLFAVVYIVSSIIAIKDEKAALCIKHSLLTNVLSALGIKKESIELYFQD